MHKQPSNTAIAPGLIRPGSAFFPRMVGSFLVVVALASPLFAAEITTYRDENGHSVYLNSEDRELRTAIKRGGVAAGLALVEQRRHALPAIEDYLEQVAQRHQVDAKLVQAIIEVESAWDPKARSPKGALGLMQLMPETAARFAVDDPLDPKKNIDGGVRYLRFLLDRFHQNLTYALGAYNAGETIVAQKNEIPPYAETQNYIKQVTKRYSELRGPIPGNRLPIHQEIEGQRIVYTNIY